MAIVISKHEMSFAVNGSRVCASVRVYGGVKAGRYGVFVGNGEGTALFVFHFENEQNPISKWNPVYDALQHAYDNIASAFKMGESEALVKLSNALMELVESWQPEPLYSEAWYENPCESRGWACSA